MSETVTFKGTIKKLEIPDHLSLTDKIEYFNENISRLNRFNYYYESSELTLEDCFRDHYWNQPEKYIIISDDIYEVLSIKNIAYEPIFEGSRNHDNSIDFLVRYYNGGTDFEEVIQEVINKT